MPRETERGENGITYADTERNAERRARDARETPGEVGESYALPRYEGTSETRGIEKALERL